MKNEIKIFGNDQDWADMPKPMTDSDLYALTIATEIALMNLPEGGVAVEGLSKLMEKQPEVRDLFRKQ